MKNEIINLLNDYKKKYPEESNKLSCLDKYLEENDNVVDWNNFNGHITVGTFVYNKMNDSFLLVFHKDFNTYIYPGGHVEITDSSIVSAALRELKEETNIENYQYITELIDIDIHEIPEKHELSLPAHKHFDFRYLVIVNDNINIKLEEDELRTFKWVSRDTFKTLSYLGDIVKKIDLIIK